ncbi:MAG: glycosyl transferase family 1 [Rhodospirillales bacterium 70-18]|nr:glycosyltransferase family 4 protein [Rhodospirillales bacterium]OJY70357.1 MAG: glycosyl transferase family 1 [Rhodospirillales bacterium 70-18]
MRILYSHRIQSRDGQSVHVEELVHAFRAAGHEVLVVGPGFYAESGFGGESRMVALLRRLLPGAAGELAELAYNLPAYRRLARACDGFRPDMLYERYNLYYLAGTWLARRRRLPFVLEVNSPLADERIRFGGLRLRRLAHALERYVWRAADRVLPVTGVLRDIIAAAGVPRERIEVVPNGIVLERFPEPAARPAPEVVVLGFVGFVRSWHGMDAVLRAIAAQTGPQAVGLTVIGDGPARPELEALAAELGIAARVRFTGLVDHAEVPGHVAGFDIALQPKVVPYASPLKIFDYMAAGRAIVAPDQPNIRELLEHERTALLFDPDEDGAMWRAIQRLIDDPALRLRLGAAARAELVARDYTWAGNARRIADWAAGAR